MLYFIAWMIALARYDLSSAEATDWIKPPSWSGNYWGPAATRARIAGHLPPLPSNPGMARWHEWGRDVLRQGDIVFRLGDARVVRGHGSPQPVHRSCDRQPLLAHRHRRDRGWIAGRL